MKQPRNRVLLWLLALNMLALTVFGGKYWYSAMKEKQGQHEKASVAATMLVKMGAMNMADATKLMELSTDLEHGAKNMSDADLDWCLDKLKGQDPSPRSAVTRRVYVDMILIESVKVLDSPQKERLFQTSATQIAMADPKEEAGVDVAMPARILGKLGDKRAIPILEAHLNDDRPMMHLAVQQAINKLEGKAAK